MNSRAERTAAEASVSVLRAAPQPALELRITAGTLYEDGLRAGRRPEISFLPGALELRRELGEFDWSVLTYLLQIGELEGDQLVTPPTNAAEIAAFQKRGRASVSASITRLRERGLITVEQLRHQLPSGRVVNNGVRYWLSNALHDKPRAQLAAAPDASTPTPAVPSPATAATPDAPASKSPAVRRTIAFDDDGAGGSRDPRGLAQIRKVDATNPRDLEDCARIAAEWQFYRWNDAVAPLKEDTVLTVIRAAAAPHVKEPGAYARGLVDKARAELGLPASARRRDSSPASTAGPRGRGSARPAAAGGEPVPTEVIEQALATLDETTRTQLVQQANDAVYDQGRDPGTRMGRALAHLQLTALLTEAGLIPTAAQ